MPRTFRCRLPWTGGPMCCSLMSNKNGPKTLIGTRMHQGSLGSLFAALIWASGISWRPRSSSLRKASEKLVDGPSLRATLIVSRSSGDTVRTASPRARAYRGRDVLVERPVVCPASKMPYSAAEIYPLKGWSSAARGMERRKISSEARRK